MLRFIKNIKISIQALWTKLTTYKLFGVIPSKYLLATFIFLLVILVLDDNNLFALIGEKKEVYQQEQLIKYYKDKIDNTDVIIKELTSNRDSLEKFARENFYFQEKDEDVYIVEP